jgi:hypothetical protein
MSEEFVSPCPNQWDFLKERGQQANIPALKDAVNQLLHLSTAKSFKAAEQGQLDALPMIKFTIICEAAALVLSGELDKLEVSDSEISKILKTEYSLEFDTLRKKMMIMGFYRYGPVRKNIKDELEQTIPSLEKRIAEYKRTGNIEFLADVANFAMMECMYSQHPNAHYNSTDDSNSPGIIGMSINEITRFKEDYNNEN